MNMYVPPKKKKQAIPFCPGRRKGSDDYRNRKTARGDPDQKYTADFNTEDQLPLGHQAGIDVMPANSNLQYLRLTLHCHKEATANNLNPKSNYDFRIHKPPLV
jgi:hypothetical protein